MKWNGAQVRALREAFGKSQAEFCGLIGVSIHTLQHWEQGKGDPPRWHHFRLDQLAAELKPEAEAVAS